MDGCWRGAERGGEGETGGARESVGRIDVGHTIVSDHTRQSEFLFDGGEKSLDVLWVA